MSRAEQAAGAAVPGDRAVARIALGLVLFVLFGACTVSVSAQQVVGASEVSEERFGDLEIRAAPQMPSARDTHGYVEHRFWVRNTSPAQAHRVTLLLPAWAPGVDSLSQISRTVEIAPGASAEVVLPRPQLSVSGSGVAVEVDGRRVRQTLPYTIESEAFWRASASGVRAILLSPRLVPEGHPDLGHDIGFLPVTLALESWSQSWFAYTGYDGIVITEDELETAPGPLQAALRRFCEMGGTLLILASEKEYLIPEKLWPEEVGFGIVLTSRATSLANLDPALLDFVKERWERSHRPWHQLRDPVSAHRAFPVVESLAIPVRGLFLLMVTFALLVGPVNFFWQRRRGRAMGILLTVPLISLLAAGAVLAYALLSEGVVRFERTETLTLLDEGQRRATTLGRSAFYSSLTPGDGLRYGLGTEVAPLRSASVGVPRTLAWERDQHLARGWLRARLPEQFQLRKSETRRERLTVRRGGDGFLEVVNGLGAPIDGLWLSDIDGRIYQGGRVEAGAAIRLEASDDWILDGAGLDDGLGELYGSDWLGLRKTLSEEPERFLVESAYIAVLDVKDANPFLESALEGARRKDCGAVVYGLLAAGDDAGAEATIPEGASP